MKLEYRLFQGGDESALSALYKEVFGVDLAPEYWEWKYQRNPAGAHIMYVALEGDKIVGGLGAIPVKVKAGSEEVLGLQTCDIVIAAKYRKGTPFFRRHKLGTEEQKRRGWGFVFGFSIETTYRLSTKMLGFVDAGPIHKIVKVLNPTLFLRGKLVPRSVATAFGACAASGLKMLNKIKIRHAEGVEIGEANRFDSTFDEFWRSRCGDFEIMIVRDSAYLNWRYCQNPAQAYRTFTAFRNGVLSAFAVVAVRQEGEFRRGYVVDLLASPEDRETMSSLFAQAITHLYGERVDSVTAWIPERTSAFHLAQRLGFVRRRTPHHLIVRGEGHLDNKYLAERSRWYIAMGDSDNY